MEVVKSSANLFRDFGHDHPGLEQLRAELATQVLGVLRERGLTVRAAEALTGVPAADFSRIRNLNIDRFTVDRLAKILWKLNLDFDVALTLRPAVVLRSR